MQLDIVDAVHLRVCRLFRHQHAQVDDTHLDYNALALTYVGADCVDSADNLHALATDSCWILGGPIGGTVTTNRNRNAVTLQLGEHMQRATYSEGATAHALQERTQELIAGGQEDAVERLGQVVEMLTNLVTHSSEGDSLILSRPRLVADIRHMLGVEEVSA